jgi:hypothetical protein
VAVEAVLAVAHNLTVEMVDQALLFFRTPDHKFFMVAQLLRLAATLSILLIPLGCCLQHQFIQ